MSSSDSANRAAILYVAARFPALSETFVYRELLGLRARGLRVLAASVHRPDRPAADPGLTALAQEALVVYSLRTMLAVPIVLLCRPALVVVAVRDAVTSDHASLRSRAKHAVQAIMGLAAGWRLRGHAIGAVHAHMAHVPATVALYIARVLGARFSFTGHASDLFVQRAALAFKLREADFTACISHWHRDFYATVTPLTPDRLPLVRCSVAPPAGVVAPRSEIVTVARLVAKKGIDLLIEAFARAAPERWTLRIIGGGPEDARLKRLAAGLGLADRIIFEGARPHADCLAAIAAGGIFVLPCRTAANGDRDGIPVVLMEAMASGRPVIAGDLPPIRELVRSGETGLLVPPDDVAALADGIAALTADPALRDRLGHAARGFVAAEFADDINLDRLTTAFRRHHETA